MFGIEEHVRKGHFPHWFKGGMDYVGPLPDLEDYGFDAYPVDKRLEARKWYKRLLRSSRDGTYVFDYKKELVEYCKNDVDILAASIKLFKELLLLATDGNIDPWAYPTIASACMSTYRSMFMPEESIPTVHTDGARRYSEKSIKWLEYLRDTQYADMQHSLRGREKWIKRDGGKKFFVDGFSPSSNTVFEFNGCEFHGCDVCKDPKAKNHKGYTYESLQRYTLDKKTELLTLGYKYVSISECAFEADCSLLEYMINNDIDLEYTKPLDPRDAFFGGRTNASKLYYKCNPDEQIKYCDFTSLYPYINATGEYPAYSHPTRILHNFDSKLEYKGFIKCHILAPRSLYHPVLPCKLLGKTMFVLCKKCAIAGTKTCCHDDLDRAIVGTWAMPEIKLALEKGYKVTKIYEVLHFERTSNLLFKDYINNFLKIKQEASGYPAWCKTKEDQQKYIDDYLQKQGIQLDAEKIIYNEGLRCVAKLMLNSLWGKFGQKNNQKQHITINVEEDPDQYYNIMFNDAYVIHDIVDYNNQRTIDMSYSLKKIAVKDDKNTSIYIAAYTTAMARCKLYSVLDILGYRVVYYDTDSIIYVDDMDNTYATQLPYGDYLGDLTDELKKDHIDEWVSEGPKNYSYVTRKGKAKTVCKGFALSYENSLQLGHHNMKDIVFGNEDAVAFKFREIAVSRTHVVSNKQKPIVIENENSSKKYKFVYDKRVVQDFNSASKGLLSVDKLYQRLKGKGITKKDISTFIKDQEVAQVHKRLPKPTYLHIVANHINHIWQTDLCDMSKYAKSNKGYTFLLCIVDVYSRYAYVFPLKTKSKLAVAKCFEQLFAQRKPLNITSDQVGDHTKMGLVERFNRTLKSLIARYMTAFRTKNYIDALPDLVMNYNTSFHTTLGKAPAEVKDGRSCADIKDADIFTKGYVAKWSTSVYQIVNVDGFKFIVAGANGVDLKRRFRHYELQKVNKAVTANLDDPKVKRTRTQAQAARELKELPITTKLPTRLRSEKAIKGTRPKGTFMHVEIPTTRPLKK
ncbi:DNA-directed DNA polymerase [Powellomyces hirtus]|uniref:Probable DNA polymerase n=1 Tax=Powellomyces hirtus TaxID=109895 RepID=A0A507DQI0_9FUNG|nr:DNA-directed DNA polymerase [Powellomyces hirtus]